LKWGSKICINSADKNNENKATKKKENQNELKTENGNHGDKMESIRLSSMRTASLQTDCRTNTK